MMTTTQLRRVLRVGPKVREARIAAGMQQQQLAAMLGKTSSSLCHLEKGKRGVSAEELAHIARILGRPFGWFVGEGEAA